MIDSVMESWLIKPKNVGPAFDPSGPTQLNLLYQSGPYYVMDNHLAALWCWAQEMKKNQGKAFLLHIDAHEDASTLALEKWQGLGCSLDSLDLPAYLALRDQEFNLPLIRWDNYLPLFLHDYHHRLAGSFACTHGIGQSGKFSQRTEMFRLLSSMKEWFESSEGSGHGWIINVDLDFFFTSLPQKKRWASESFLNEFFALIKQVEKRGDLISCTLALSPECCGGWGPSLQLMQEVARRLSLPFSL